MVSDAGLLLVAPSQVHMPPGVAHMISPVNWLLATGHWPPVDCRQHLQRSMLSCTDAPVALYRSVTMSATQSRWLPAIVPGKPLHSEEVPVQWAVSRHDAHSAAIAKGRSFPGALLGRVSGTAIGGRVVCAAEPRDAA